MRQENRKPGDPYELQRIDEKDTVIRNARAEWDRSNKQQAFEIKMQHHFCLIGRFMGSYALTGPHHMGNGQDACYYIGTKQGCIDQFYRLNLGEFSTLYIIHEETDVVE